MPRSKDHRVIAFYRAACQRFEESKILLKEKQPTGAVYLAAYGAECILKALILSSIDDPKRRSVVDQSFKGRAGHDIADLLRLVLKEGGRTVPSSISRSLEMITSWTTDLRYDVSVKSLKEANSFVAAVADLIGWADECMNYGAGKSK